MSDVNMCWLWWVASSETHGREEWSVFTGSPWAPTSPGGPWSPSTPWKRTQLWNIWNLPFFFVCFHQIQTYLILWNVYFILWKPTFFLMIMIFNPLYRLYLIVLFYILIVNHDYELRSQKIWKCSYRKYKSSTFISYLWLFISQIMHFT